MSQRHRPFQASIGLGLSLWLGLACPWAAYSQTDWYTLKANGKAIGTVGIHRYPAPDNPASTITEINQVNHFTRQGNPFEVHAQSRFVEAPKSNQAERFSYRYHLGDDSLLEADGQLGQNALDLRLLRENGESLGQTPITKKQFLFPEGEKIRQVYRQHYSDRSGSQFRYQTLHLGIQPQVVNTTVTTLQREKLALGTGEVKPVRKYELSNPSNKTQKIYEWRDEQGKLYKSQSLGTQAGLEMVYASQREVQALNQQAMELMEASAIVSTRIPQPRTTVQALFKISPVQGQPLALKGLFPETLYQKLVSPPNLNGPGSTQAESIYLQVRQQEPSNVLATYPIPFSAQYLEATPYLQVHDPILDGTALAVAEGEKRAYYAARKLQQWVYQNIAQKDFSLGFASAKETFDRKQGDCTEHAVLLTSLLRSLGIPARVAIGLIYLPDEDSSLGRFVFHMWTEAYIGNSQAGEWVPLDATNPEPVPDATHIKLADSPLSEAGDLLRLTEQVTAVLGKLRVDVIQGLASAQSLLKVEPKGGITHLEIEPVDIQRLDIQTSSQQAIQHYRVTPEPKALSENTPTGLFTRGVEAQSHGQPTQARDFYRQALDKTSQPIALYLLGERLASMDQYDLAQQALALAQQKDQRLTPWVADWMSSVLATENGIKTISLEAAQAPPPPDSLSTLEKTLRENPRNFLAAERLGDLYQASQRPDLAKAAYQAALNTLENRAFTQGRPWQSALQGKLWIVSAQERLNKNSKDARAWFLLGQGLAQQNNMTEARTAFSNALRLEPTNSQATLAAFEAALTQLDWNYLQEHYAEINALSGGNATASRLKAYYLMRQRQYGPALLAAQKAIALNPTQGSAYHLVYQIEVRLADQALWQNNTTGQEKAKGYWQKAEAALRKGATLANNPTVQSELLQTLGQSLMENNRPAEALEIAEDILRREPLNGRAYWQKGQAMLLQGEYQRAKSTLNTALLLLPNDPDTLISLGQLAQEEGRDAQAMAFYQQAYTADPGHYGAANHLRSLIEALQVSAKKPPAIMRLTPDEHDYLVQLLRLKAKFSHALVGDGHSYLKFINDSEKLNIDLVNRIRDHLLQQRNSLEDCKAVYQHIANLPTPPRFRQLRYHELEYQRIIMVMINEGLTDNGLFSEAHLKKITDARNQRMAQLSQLEQAQRQTLQNIYAQISNTELVGLTAEAGWNPWTNPLENAQTLQAISKAVGHPKAEQEKTTQGKARNGVASPSKLATPLSRL